MRMFLKNVLMFFPGHRGRKKEGSTHTCFPLYVNHTSDVMKLRKIGFECLPTFVIRPIPKDSGPPLVVRCFLGFKIYLMSIPIELMWLCQ